MRRRTSFTPIGRIRAAAAQAACRCAAPTIIDRCMRPAGVATIRLLRTYSGTDDFIRLAEMYIETINIAWCAIPLFWFNQMDGRGPWDVAGSIGEHQPVMKWYGERDIPVELNEPHHWGMRDASDVDLRGRPLICRPTTRALLACTTTSRSSCSTARRPVRCDGPGQDAGHAGYHRTVGRGRTFASGGRRAPAC